MSEYGPEMVVGVPKGWQCPVCGRVYAPFMPMCSHCGKDGGPHPSRPSVDLPSPPGDGLGECGEWVDVFRTCEKCGGEMQWHKDIMVTSLPAKWEYQCKVCGNVEYEQIGTAHPPYTVTLNNGKAIL